MRKELNKPYRIYFLSMKNIDKMRWSRKLYRIFYFTQKTKKEALGVRKQYKKLTYADRQTIERMSRQGIAAKAIALETGVHIATIYREMQRGSDPEGHYKAELAQQALFS